MFIFQKIKSFFTNTQPPLNNNNTPYNLLACPSLQVSQIQNIQDIIEKYGNKSIKDNHNNNSIQQAYDKLISISSIDENIRLYLHELMFFTSIRMENAVFYVDLAKLIITNYPHLQNFLESQIYWSFDNSADLFVYLSINKGLLREENLKKFEKYLSFGINFYHPTYSLYNPSYRYMNFLYLHKHFDCEYFFLNSVFHYYYSANKYILYDPEYKQKMRECVNTNPITAAIRSDNSKLIDGQNIDLEPNIIDRNECIRFGCNMLEYSAFYGSINCFKKLIENNDNILNTEKSVNINIWRDKKLTICDLAACGGNLEICQILYENGFNFTSQSLQYSIRYHRFEVFQWLTNELNIVMDKKCYKISIQYEFIPAIELFQKYNSNEINVNLALSKSGNYVLFCNFIKINDLNECKSFMPVFLYNCVDCYRFLLNKKINLNQCCWFDKSMQFDFSIELFPPSLRYRNPFQVAISHQYLDLIKMILKYGVIDLNRIEKLISEDSFGSLNVAKLPPIAIAIYTENVEIVEFLLQINEIDVNQEVFLLNTLENSDDCEGHLSIIRLARYLGNLDILNVLLNSPKIRK